MHNLQFRQFRQKIKQFGSLMLLLSGLGAGFSSSALAQSPARPPVRPPLSPSRQPLETPSLPLPATPPSDGLPTTPTPELSAIAEQFVDLVAAGEFEQARRLLSPTLRRGWTAAEMQSNWESLQKVVGPYQKRSSTQIVDDNLALVDLEFANTTDNLLILFDASGRFRESISRFNCRDFNQDCSRGLLTEGAAGCGLVNSATRFLFHLLD